MRLLGHQKNRQGGRVCTQCSPMSRRVTVNLVNGLEVLRTWKMFFTCRWLELNSPMDDAAFAWEEGSWSSSCLEWLTGLPKISLIQKLSQAWDYLRALMLSKLQIGDEHCVGQVNRVIEHRSSTVSSPLPGVSFYKFVRAAFTLKSKSGR